ncbi:MAG: semialdehyde dehydrogenase, partial [Porphyromonadaceae bacterium]|nr:semialdehyde dehydrogenase [Porphyromonadaceae bacterium]
MKRAWVLGATGATGTALVEQLLKGDEYSEVHVFVRRPLQLQHAKLHVHVVDME